jgi:hypothetical protein
MGMPDLNRLIPVAIKMATMPPPSTTATIRALGEYPSRVKILPDRLHHLQSLTGLPSLSKKEILTRNTLSETIQCRRPLATRSGIP